MCEVHLVPEKDELCKADAPSVCGECGKLILVGQDVRLIEGPLDDGSGERYRYEAHEECYLASVDDVGPEGCFTYGSVKRIA